MTLGSFWDHLGIILEPLRYINKNLIEDNNSPVSGKNVVLRCGASVIQKPIPNMVSRGGEESSSYPSVIFVHNFLWYFSGMSYTSSTSNLIFDLLYNFFASSMRYGV